MSGLELFPQRRQAFAFFPVVEAGPLLAAVEARGSIAEMGQGVRLQFLMQQLPDDVTHLLDGETRRRLFPPAVSPASGTNWRST